MYTVEQDEKSTIEETESLPTRCGIINERLAASEDLLAKIRNELWEGCNPSGDEERHAVYPVYCLDQVINMMLSRSCEILLNLESILGYLTTDQRFEDFRKELHEKYKNI